MRHMRVTTAVVPVLAGAVAVVLSASPAGAHVGGHVSGLADGALHPLTALDHLLAMLSVGVLAVLTGRFVAFPAAFLLGMAVGGAAGIAGIVFPGVELAIAVSVVGLGIAVALAPRADATWLLTLVATAGVVPREVHGAGTPGGPNPGPHRPR